jgi:hypothetical protein
MQTRAVDLEPDFVAVGAGRRWSVQGALAKTDIFLTSRLAIVTVFQNLAASRGRAFHGRQADAYAIAQHELGVKPLRINHFQKRADFVRQRFQ